ncbi:hypothetical protein [Hydromonas duriensis]|uniref:Lipoprotein n=1 Tax=Hydromonas duriensis TaxID=1527608 RepID=A0A4R6YBD0_9BURK|nr:hypothetical protein [Hydromonas duriensis]TDR32954.1 hypothetical protein DFR44_1013 [Hydromonas duriensis]
MKKMIVLLFTLIATGCWVREYDDHANVRIDSGFIYQKDGDYCFTTQSLMEGNQLIDLITYWADINGGKNDDDSPSVYERPPKPYLSSCIPLSQLNSTFTSALSTKEGKVKFTFRFSENKDSGYRPDYFNFTVNVCKKGSNLVMSEENGKCT